MQLRSLIAMLFVGSLSLPLTMCSSDDSNTSSSSSSCSCHVTVDGAEEEWSGCQKEVCVGGVAYVCSTTGAIASGDCSEGNPEPSDPNPDNPSMPKDAGTGTPTPKDAGTGTPTPKDAGTGTPTPKDAGAPLPFCDVSKTFKCGSATCKLSQICDSKKSLCYDVPKEDQCTPCSTQYAVTKGVQCPSGYISKLSGSASTGCTNECR